MTMGRWLQGVVLLFALACGMSARADDVSVSGAWVHSTVPGQTATGAFMTIRSATDAQLLSVKAHVAGVAQVHQMVMNGSVMTMRAVAVLELPAKKDVVLKPTGLHIMLQDLRHPLLTGEHVQLILEVRASDGQTRQQFVEAEVRAAAPE
jgi:copper(I)-binding protein